MTEIYVIGIWLAAELFVGSFAYLAVYFSKRSD